MVSISEYCPVIGGEPSAILDIYSETNEYVSVNTEETPSAPTGNITIIGKDRPSELTLTTRENLRQDLYFKALAKVGKDAIKHLSDYSTQQLQELVASVTDTLQQVQTTGEDIIQDLTLATQQAINEQETTDNYIEGVLNLL